METGVIDRPEKEYRIRFSEKIYRLHEGGIMNHAPEGRGLFEIVFFPPGAADGEVVYVGRAEGPNGDCATLLAGIQSGRHGASPEALVGILRGLEHAYFDYLEDVGDYSDEDLADVAWALVQQKKPRFNAPDEHPHSGRWSEITLAEGVESAQAV
jgi:hypothetical protein